MPKKLTIFAIIQKKEGFNILSKKGFNILRL